MDDPERAALEAALAMDPANLALAWRYWHALGTYRNCDIRDGGYVVQAFRAVALASAEGAAAFAQAYHELFFRSGESPRSASVDRELRAALQRALRTLQGEARRSVQWVIDCVVPIDGERAAPRSNE
jgi:hypothetical protein